MSKEKQLIQTLENLVQVYRNLLNIVKKENDVLSSTQFSEIEQINFSKEKLLLKVRELEIQWQKSADLLAQRWRLPNSKPSLLELANHPRATQGPKLKKLRQVLNELIERVFDWNKKNASLIKTTLSHITGAMDSITEFLNENPRYGSQGSMSSENKDAQGRLVQREA